MPDYTLQPQNTLVVGTQGSGKTTVVIRYLLNATPVCRFIFDDEGRTAPRLRLNPAFTERQLEESLAGRWVVFNPARMFPFADGDRDLLAPTRRAFRYFCAWVFDCCKRVPGQKIVSVPEVWRYCTADSIPAEFARLIQQGREEGIHVICDTQRPELVNASIIGQATELICFRLMSREALRVIEKEGADAAKVASLPLGSFVAYNRLSGATLSGRVF